MQLGKICWGKWYIITYGFSKQTSLHQVPKVR